MKCVKKRFWNKNKMLIYDLDRNEIKEKRLIGIFLRQERIR